MPGESPSALVIAAFACLFAALGCGLGRAPLWRSAALASISLILAGLAQLLAWPALLVCALGAALATPGAIGAPWLRYLRNALLIVLVLLLVAHRLPGFSPLLWQSDFGRGALRPLLWHFDKGWAALLLMLWLARSPAPVAAATSLAGRLLLLALPLLLIPALAVWLGLAHWQPAAPSGWALFLIGNLFLTVVAEEALFRGLLQARLAYWWREREVGGAGAIVVAAVVFGLAHAPWGGSFAVAAGVAGLCYGLVFARAGLAWAIAAHFACNALLFLGFSSPLG